MIELYLDTTDRLRAKVSLKMNEKVFEEELVSERPKSDVILPLVEKLCVSAGITPSEISRVFVEPGPGSYTGVRLGISIANALGLATGSIVNGMPKGTLVEAKYA